jgi:hypothetical protein
MTTFILREVIVLWRRLVGTLAILLGVTMSNSVFAGNSPVEIRLRASTITLDEVLLSMQRGGFPPELREGFPKEFKEVFSKEGISAAPIWGSPNAALIVRGLVAHMKDHNPDGSSKYLHIDTSGKTIPEAGLCVEDQRSLINLAETLISSRQNLEESQFHLNILRKYHIGDDEH